MGKDLEDRDFVSNNGGRQGVLLDGEAKPTPDGPIGVLTRNNSGLNRFFCKAEINAEIVGVRRGQSFQDSAYG